MKKRLSALILVLSLVATVIPIISFSAQADITTSNGLVYVLSDDSTKAFLKNGNAIDGSITIPNTISVSGKTYPVTEIKANAFSGTSVKSVVIPSSVTVIEDRAFAYCPTLTSIDLSSANVSLGNEVFKGSPNLETVNNYANIEVMGYGVFDSTAWYNNVISGAEDEAVYIGKVLCKYFGDASDFEIASGCTAIAADAFIANKTLVSIDLSAVKYIGKSAFENCSSLKNVTFGSSLISVDSSAFENCSSLSGNIILPASLTTLSGNAFEASSITSADLSATKITSVGNGVFMNCNKLEKISLPASVSKIDNYSFYGCSLLSDINASSVTYIGYDAFRGCKVLADDSAFANAEYIGSGAFDGTELYTSAEKGYSVIGKAFYKTENTEVAFSVPAGVKQISPYAFYAAENFEMLALPVSLEKINEDVFMSMEDGTIYVFSKNSEVYESLALLTSGTVYIPEGMTLDNPDITIGYITGITVKNGPTKNTYYPNDKLDPTGIKIVLNTKLNGVSSETDIDNFAYVPEYTYNFNSSTDVTVSYCGFTTTTKVELYDILLGDANGDGSVTPDDLALLRKYIAGLVSADEINLAACQLEDTPGVTPDDLAVMRKVLAGLITLK